MSYYNAELLSLQELEQAQMDMAYKFHYEELFTYPELQECPEL